MERYRSDRLARGYRPYDALMGRRHVVFLEGYPHVLGGGQAVTEMLAVGLPDRGWTTEVVAPRNGPALDELRARSVKVTVLPAGAGLLRYGRRFGAADTMAATAALPAWWVRLARHLRRQQARLLDVADERGLILGAAPATFARVPLVWHIHAAGWAPGITRFGQVAARRCIVPSTGMAAGIGGRHHAVIPPSLRQVPMPSRQRASGEPPRVVTSGRIEPIKGFEVLIDAAAQLAPRFPGLAIEIFGGVQDGHENHARELQKRCCRLGLTEVVRFVGHVPRPWERWNGATVYVQSSRSESFGLSLIEAMASGLAVVATRVSGSSDIIDDGRSGLLVPPDDPSALAVAVERLLTEPGRAERLAAEGQRHVLATYTPERLVDATTDVYEQVSR